MIKAPANERELNRAIGRDLDATFELLVETYQHRLFAFAVQLSGSREDAEEIAQDAFVRAYHALRTYSPERIESLALKPWLYRITLNLARNHHRRISSRISATSIEPDGSSNDDFAQHRVAADERHGPELTALRYEQSSVLTDLLFALPERYRVPVILRHVQGLTYPDAARVLNQPQGTIKANVHRGVRMLRDSVAKRAPHLIAVTEGGQ